MKTPEKLKGAIRNFAASKNLKPQVVLQMFLFERFIERLALSDFKGHFIVKGGLLISSMIGVENRTTMDMDAAVRGVLMDEGIIREVIEKLIKIETDDGVQFEFQKIEPIREEDEYKNFRIHLYAKFGKINAPLKLDLTTGDVITPKEIQYPYRMLFEDRTIMVSAYNIETILAEKYETILRRNIGTTRARDFYDLYVLFKTKFHEIDRTNLQMAVANTARHRNSLDYINEWNEICEEMKQESALVRLWSNYQR